MIQIGLLSAILGEMTFEDVISFASDCGFRGVEVCAWPRGASDRRYGGVTHIDLDDPLRGDLQNYVKVATQKGITLSSLAYYPNPLSGVLAEAELAQSHIKRLIHAAAELGIGMVTTFIGKDQNLTVEENLVNFEKVWNPIISLAENKRVRVAIENCPMYFTRDEWPGGKNLASSPELISEIFKRIPSDYLGLNYDPSHLRLMQADYVQPIYTFANKIFHVHLKDIRIYPDKLNRYGAFSYPTLWHSPKIPGMGDLSFGSIISALHDVGFEGYACIEIEDKTFEKDLQTIIQGIRQSYAHIRQYI